MGRLEDERPLACLMSGEGEGERPSGLLGEVVVPSEPPSMHADLLQEVCTRLDKKSAPFVTHLDENLSLEWLQPGDDRLGVTRFEADHNEMFRRRRLKLAPGKVTILLHPALVGDEALYRHTLVHELLHAAGLLEHDDSHTGWVGELAPPPGLADSPLLQELRAKVLGQMRRSEWACAHCGFSFARRTVRKPRRCPKCARPL